MKVDLNVQNNAHKPAFGAYASIYLGNSIAAETAPKVIKAFQEEIGNGLVRLCNKDESLSKDALFVGFNGKEGEVASKIVIATGENSTNAQNMPILKKAIEILKRFDMSPKDRILLADSPSGHIEVTANRVKVLANIDDATITHNYAKASNYYAHIDTVVEN